MPSAWQLAWIYSVPPSIQESPPTHTGADPEAGGWFPCRNLGAACAVGGDRRSPATSRHPTPPQKPRSGLLEGCWVGRDQAPPPTKPLAIAAPGWQEVVPGTGTCCGVGGHGRWEQLGQVVTSALHCLSARPPCSWKGHALRQLPMLMVTCSLQGLRGERTCLRPAAHWWRVTATWTKVAEHGSSSGPLRIDGHSSLGST